MKLKYLGSGGGGGIPELFCSCSVCMNARNKRGEELRRRSLAIINDELVVDLPCDARDSFIAHDVDPGKIAYILITHSHYDHFLADNLLTRPYGAKQADLYISHESGKAFAQRCGTLEKLSAPEGLLPINAPRVHLKHAFESFEVGPYRVTTLDSGHARSVETLNFIIQQDDNAILWLHDSGVLSDATKTWLETNVPNFSLVSMDCSLPIGASKSSEHMDLYTCVETANYLKEIRCANEKTRFILSHISHNAKMTHEELITVAQKYGLTPAFDGREVCI